MAGIKLKLSENQKRVGIVLAVIVVALLLNMQFGFLSAGGTPSFTPPPEVVSQGEVLSISPTYYQTCADAGVTGCSTPIVMVQMAMTGSGDWAVGETASTTESEWANENIANVEGNTVKPRVPFEMAAQLKSNGCEYVLNSRADTISKAPYNTYSFSYKNVYLKSGNVGTDLSCAAAPQVIAGITFPGSQCSYAGNGLAIGCENSYKNTCEKTSSGAATGYYSMSCTTQVGGVEVTGRKCVKLVPDQTYTPAFSDSVQFYTRVEGQVYVNTQQTESFVCDSKAGNACTITRVGGTSTLKRVNIAGGFVTYSHPQCPDSITGIWDATGSNFKILSTESSVARESVVNPPSALASGASWNTLNTVLNNWNQHITRLLSTPPDYSILPSGNIHPQKTSGTQADLIINASATTPLISMYLDAENVGVMNIPTNVSITCPSGTLTGTVGGIAVPFIITATNHGGNGQAEIAIDTTSCSGVSSINNMPDEVSFTSTTPITLNYAVNIANEGNSNCRITAKERAGNSITGSCTLNLHGDPLCTASVAPPRPTGDYWVLNPTTCRWDCPTYSCSGSTVKDTETCSCTSCDIPAHAHLTTSTSCQFACNQGYALVGGLCVESGGITDCHDTISLPTNAHWLNEGICTYECNEGFEQISLGGNNYECRLSACTQNSQCGSGEICQNGSCVETCASDSECASGWSCTEGVCEPPPLTCAQRVDARVCEIWDLTCAANKNMDKIGCSIQDAITTIITLVIYAAIGGVIIFGIIKYVVPAMQKMAKKRGRKR